MLKKYFIAYPFELIDFLFVATFVIKIKKRTKVRQTFQISLTDVNLDWKTVRILAYSTTR